MEDSDQRSVCQSLPVGVEADRFVLLSAVRAHYVAELIAVLRVSRSVLVNAAPTDLGYYRV